MKLALSIICALGLPLGAMAQTLQLPTGARLVSERISPLASYSVPTGGFVNGAVPQNPIEGTVQRRSWRIDGGSSTVLQLMDPLREQLQAGGYEIEFECGTRDCGGFDFRFGIEVIPAPDMAVDIGNFRFLSAIRATDQAATVLVSRLGSSSYVQIIEVSNPSDPVPASAPRTVLSPDEAENTGLTEITGLMEQLLAEGRVVLDDLLFQTGSALLGETSPASLASLTAVLEANADYRLVLVGHTDSVGALEDNIELSRQRAETVRQLLIDEFNVGPDRIDAEGVGYLSPLTSNLKEEGRRANRRVEAVLLTR